MPPRSNPKDVEIVNEKEDEAPKLRPMLSTKQLLKIVPFSRATLDRKVLAGTFPKPKVLSTSRVAWFEDEVIAWQKALKDA
jgi:predicted DNA-binding transcriptional regulator AlpA